MIKSLRQVAIVLAAATCTASPTTITAAPADAASSARCTAVRETKGSIGLDKHRARVSCSYIPNGYKVRAKLQRDVAKDYTSDWFTTRNKSYYTGYATCYAGCRATYDVVKR